MGKDSAATCSVVVHGLDSADGRPVTLHLTPVVAGALRRRVDFLVEQADGRIMDDEAWLTAIKTVELMSAEDAHEMVGDPAGDW